MQANPTLLSPATDWKIERPTAVTLQAPARHRQDGVPTFTMLP
jgi:hypothetical protein